MESQKISARVELNAYTMKVLAVLKAKYDLNDKSEAIDKFIEMYGDDIVDKVANDQYVKHILEVSNEHLQKHRKKKMTLKELDALCEV